MVFLLALFLGLSVLAEPLSSVEQQIVAHIDLDEPDAIRLLEKVVNINSGTMKFDGMRKVGDIFADEYRRLGFSTRWIDGAPFGAPDTCSPALATLASSCSWQELWNGNRENLWNTPVSYWNLTMHKPSIRGLTASRHDRGCR